MVFNLKSTLYIKEFDQFVNIFNFTKGNNYKLSIIVAHNIESEIKVFKNELLLNNTKTSIILTDGQIVSFDNKPLSKFPNKKIVVENNEPIITNLYSGVYIIKLNNKDIVQIEKLIIE